MRRERGSEKRKAVHEQRQQGKRPCVASMAKEQAEGVAGCPGEGSEGVQGGLCMNSDRDSGEGFRNPRLSAHLLHSFFSAAGASAPSSPQGPEERERGWQLQGAQLINCAPL